MICNFNRQAQLALASTMNSTNHHTTGTGGGSASAAHQTSTTPNAATKISNYWKSKSKHTKKLLSPTFVPSDYSVICGRTKFCFDSVGNRRFRLTVAMFRDEYKEATGKAEKSKIVSRVFNLIREASPEGAFVTFENGRWWECSERISREKIGAAFRDLLHETYKSSSKSKQAKKNSSSTIMMMAAMAGSSQQPTDDASYNNQATFQPLQQEQQQLSIQVAQQPQQEQEQVEFPQQTFSLPMINNDAPAMNQHQQQQPQPQPQQQQQQKQQQSQPFLFPAFFDDDVDDDSYNTRHFYPVHNNNDDDSDLLLQQQIFDYPYTSV